MEDIKKENNKKRMLKLITRYFMYAIFLSLFLVAFTTYRRIILGEYHISYKHYGIGIIEAFILSKLIIIGQEIKLGERFSHKPLIISTFYKTLVFMIFLFLLIVLEHFIVGYFSGKSLASIYHEFIVNNFNEILARVLIMFFFFILFFALLDIERAVGKEKLFHIFIKGTTKSPEEK